MCHSQLYIIGDLTELLPAWSLKILSLIRGVLQVAIHETRQRGGQLFISNAMALFQAVLDQVLSQV